MAWVTSICCIQYTGLLENCPTVQSAIRKIDTVYHSLYVLILHKLKTHITLDYLTDFHTSVVDISLLLRHYAESLGE